jgi:IS30 family transposase
MLCLEHKIPDRPSATPATQQGSQLPSTPLRKYRQLQPEDRVTRASLVPQKIGVRAMAQVLGRSPSTISRELRRNAQPKGCASTSARVCAQQRRRHGRAPGKLHQQGILFALVRHFLSDERWSPEQIALTLAALHPKGHE